jgi:phospholipase/lecithinase/hemolysin
MNTHFSQDRPAMLWPAWLVLFCATVVWSSATGANQHPYSRIVVFGASLTDPGNFYELEPQLPTECGTFKPRMNWPPYPLLSDDPFDYRTPDRPYLTGDRHFSNGETFVEVFARAIGLGLSVGPAADDRIPGASNYAVAGARATSYPCRLNLPWQVEQFKADFRGKVPRNALYVFEIGGNDVRDALLLLPDQTAAGAALAAALEALGKTAQELQVLGARSFLFLNVPDLAALPAVRQIDAQLPGVAAGATALTQGYNAGLDALVAALDGLPSVDAKVIDAYTLFKHIVEQPHAYGFSNAEQTCITPRQLPYECRRPDDYVFWDGIHPTRSVHAIFAIEALRVLLHR